MSNKNIIVISLFFLVFLSSCVYERQMANAFLNQRNIAYIQISFTDEMLLSNYLSDSLINSITQSNNNNNMVFTDYLDREKALNIFRKAFIEELQKYGIPLIVDTNQQTLSTEKEAQIFRIHLAQIEVVEYQSLYKDELTTATQSFYKEIPYRAIDLNTWFEYDYNNKTTDTTVLYSSHSLKEKITGYFKNTAIGKGSPIYQYEKEGFGLKKVYGLYSYAGILNARYFFNYILNQYILLSAKQHGKKPRFFYHYNPIDGRLIIISNPGFKKL